MRQRTIMFLTVTLLLAFLATAACAGGDVEQHRDCRHCGMDRKAFGYSRMLVEYRGGEQVGTCSLHCTVTELDGSNGREIISLKVADRDTRELIDAEKAVWVIGGTKRGVMTKQPKWAFATREAAQKFVENYGGVVAGWKEALAAARAEVHQKPNT